MNEAITPGISKVLELLKEHGYKPNPQEYGAIYSDLCPIAFLAYVNGRRNLGNLAAILGCYDGLLGLTVNERRIITMAADGKCQRHPVVWEVRSRLLELAK